MRLSIQATRNCSIPSFLFAPTPFIPPPLSQPQLPQYPRYFATEVNPEEHPWPTQPSPTPYQIFNSAPKSPYSKRKYYELVKLYHPDHRHYRNTHISDAVRLERFRLIVAANSILSNPVKKTAYDRYGAGWGYQDSTLHPMWAAREGHYTRGGFPGYGKGGPDDPAGNATWEDWEKWYQRQAAKDQEPQKEVYTSNNVFLAVVIMFAAIGGLANINYASSSGGLVVKEVEKKNKEIGSDLERRKLEASGGTKDERVQRFLRNRDPWKYTHRVENEEVGRRGMLVGGEERLEQ
ncbi:hypothetical protein RUND412_000044 [Rhizina undulata]